MNKEKLEQLKEEISKMTKAEQIRQLEWSDHHEFSYGYAYYLLEENQQLNEEINELELTIGLRQTRNLIHKFDKEFDEEDKKKNPNRDYAGIMPDAEEVYKRYYKQQERINKAIEHINKFEDIKAYYSYEEDGYEEYNYDEDFKIDLLEILEGGD